jgi:glycogen operon protein
VFFDLIQQDPVISQVKLIAEPWDIGPGGYQVGNFPPLWTEWNGKYRDTVRDFWRGEHGTLGEFASRLTGSSDLYQDDGRRPYASINFVTAHDGFTLADLVSYNDKHNEANLEDNRDGSDDNRSWNCGAEGPTDDPAILELRARQRRNFVATMLVSQGVPMLVHGDEMARTQDGNNNVYCQDNALSWVDWELAEKNADLLNFVSGVSAIRQAHPVFRRRRFFLGRALIRGAGDDEELRDIAWFTPAGEEMTDRDWSSGFGQAIVVFLNGDAIPDVDERGDRVLDDSFLLCFNASGEDIGTTLPDARYGASWAIVVDTARGEVVTLTTAPGTVPAEPRTASAGSMLTVPARSLLVLQRMETKSE